jgi:hypothetical protein
MKKIKKLFYKALSLILIILSTGHETLKPQSLLMGTIQFAKSAIIDPIRIYYGGKIIPTNEHETNIPKITYDIVKGNEQTTFYMLITQMPPKHQLKNAPDQDDDQNTIDYLAIHPETPYKFYKLELIKDEPTASETQTIATTSSYHWNINEDLLPTTGKLPDTAIIINYFPTFIKAVKGGTGLELPTIFVDNSLIEHFGSQENFEDALIELQLASLHTDIIHAPVRRKMKNDKQRLLIMDTLT